MLIFIQLIHLVFFDVTDTMSHELLVFQWITFRSKIGFLPLFTAAAGLLSLLKPIYCFPFRSSLWSWPPSVLQPMRCPSHMGPAAVTVVFSFSRTWNTAFLRAALSSAAARKNRPMVSSLESTHTKILLDQPSL